MNDLIGKYKLLTHGTFGQENIFTPTSDYLKGELIYSSEGYLSVIIFFNDDSEIPRKFLGYSGTYKVTSGNEVIHKINICSNSKKDSTEELRNYRLVDNFLFLSCDLDGNNKFEAKWERLN